MTYREREEMMKRVDDVIKWKLDALRERIWKELVITPEDELEEFADKLRISAVFTTDTETYVELQGELGSLVNRIANGKESYADRTKFEIMRKLCGGKLHTWK